MSPETLEERGAVPDGLPKGPRALVALFATLVAGVGVAVYLVQHKLRISFDPDYRSSCNLSDTINCDRVNVSDASQLFGLPIALYAIPTYLVMAYLGWQALKAHRSGVPAERERGRTALEAAGAVGVLTVLMSAYLAYYSHAVVGSWCLYCISLYVVNVLATVLVVMAGPRRVGAAISGALKALADLKQPLVSAFGVFVIAGGLSWVVYDVSLVSMDEARKAQAAEEMAQLDRVLANQAAGGNTPSDVSAPASPAPAPSTASSPGKRRLPDPASAVRKGTKGKDGWVYFETPVDEANEFWFGNPEAKVTVVKYADFQCGYCKYLAKSMEPVKKKFKDQVRFVMKNFPMNIKCNRTMGGYDKHPEACESAYAGFCAGEQGKFWEMHDVLYDNQKSLTVPELRGYAHQLGLDLGKFDACMASPDTQAAIQNDIDIALRAGIYGTPRTYINNRLVTGSASSSILEYHIQRALQGADSPAGEGDAPVTMAATPDGRSMVAVKTAKGEVWVDPYEAAITADGAAVSIPGVAPARVSWHTAKEACEASGKRLCQEDEWVSACAGQPAVDNNGNGYFGDDAVEGNMYPYGPFHEAGRCHDQADKYEGRPVRTGSLKKCRTPAGVFDQAGNIGEWVGVVAPKAALMGGHSSTGERAACNQRSASSGAGRRNHTTGFRCCADTNVTTAQIPDEDDLKPHVEISIGQSVPAFSANDTEEKEIRSRDFTGQVTLLNFFASWCGPCKKEMPYLANYQRKFGPKGLQIIGIGVDSQAKRSIEFAAGYDVNFPIITDPESRLMGEFGVFSMPATFIVDRKGVIRYMDTGFKPEEQAAPLQRTIEDLVAE